MLADTLQDPRAEGATEAPLRKTRGDAETLPDTLDAPPEDAAPVSRGGTTRWTAARLPEVDPKRYVVSGMVARGGLGRVMRAEDVHMGRLVALKELIDRGGDAEDRFVREALLTSRLQHPSIVPVYEAGRWPTGAPFYAMKLVAGRSLAEVIEEPRGLDERLPLVPHVLAVAQAMAYAHAERIIHRDLKPANVLVGDFGETVVIDWGLAKELPPDRSEVRTSVAPTDEMDSEEWARDALTVVGTVVGTPAYMPPEQAAGGAVDERADVYAVGAMLYHLLSGAPPYEGTARKVVNQVLQQPPPLLAERAQGVPEDLLAIVGKAMARRPEERYPSARELADDLGRFHAGQLVGAHRYSRRELALRFARRHRAALSVAAAAALVLGSGGTYGVLGVMHARDREAEERVMAERAREQAEQARKAAVDRADQLLLVEARTALERDPNETLVRLASLSSSFEAWDTVRALAVDAEGRGIARMLRGHRKLVSTVVYAPDGKTLYSASDDRTVRAWDLVGGKHRELVTHGDEVWRLSVSPDGRRIATASKDQEVRVVDVATGAATTLKGHTGSVNGAVFTPDGQSLFSFAGDATVRRWDLATGMARVLCADSGACTKVVVSQDRRSAVVADLAGKLALLDLETGALKRPPLPVKVLPDIVRLMGFMPMDLMRDGRRIAAGDEDGRLWVWEPGTGTLRSYADHEAPLFRVRFSPDGQWLASADESGVVRLRHLERGTMRVARGHEGPVYELVFSPDGRWLASGGADHSARLWDVETDQRRVLHGARDVLLTLAFSPDGRSLAASGVDGVVRIFRVDAGSSRILGRHEGPALTLGLDAREGRAPRAVTGGADGQVLLWSVDEGSARALSGHRGKVRQVAFSPDGASIVSSGEDRVVRIQDTEGRTLHEVESKLSDTEGAAPDFAFSVDGSRLAVAGDAPRFLHLSTGDSKALRGFERELRAIDVSADGEEIAATDAAHIVRVWGAASDAPPRVLGAHTGEAVSIAFSPMGGLIASGGHDHQLDLWTLGSSERRSIQPGGLWVGALEFARGGELLLGLTGLATILVWDVKAGSLRHELRGHAGVVTNTHASADGNTVVSTSVDGTVRVWDLATRRAQILRGHAGTVHDARILPDGRGFVSVGQDGTVRLWRDALPRDPVGLRAWIAATVTSAGLAGADRREDDAEP
ncbi:WD40 repeat domain-containing serine/threonine protein kinase [Chondromyces crocatus]|uniref:Protein kinase n=1 Tax=Chondromyces crocatus TaxID=52 RepID=A0A0K1E970_CHOCO|nr:protein kinase [Chondromyces crocatus]AKT37420.1 protein kinase [Chondromyces crocatus]